MMAIDFSWYLLESICPPMVVNTKVPPAPVVGVVLAEGSSTAGALATPKAKTNICINKHFRTKQMGRVLHILACAYASIVKKDVF